MDHRTTPAWARPALLGLLAATALLYLWDLGASGYANTYYAAAVQAGSQDWKALLFGSFDSSVPSPSTSHPRPCGSRPCPRGSSASPNLEHARPRGLEGVAAVALLYGAVRRVAGHGTGLAAGALLALTPAAVLMFRFNNLDALLTVLLTGSAYAVTRAVENGRTRWLVLAGTCVGFAFLTKMWGRPSWFSPGWAWRTCSPGRRGSAAGSAACSLPSRRSSSRPAGGWPWSVLWPASSRPYVGGSTTNLVLDLAFGYNGLGRIFGGSGNGGGGAAAAGGGGGFGGTANAGFGGRDGTDPAVHQRVRPGDRLAPPGRLARHPARPPG